jgi:transposase
MSKLPSDLSSVTTIAVDLAKHVFQVHGCDATGRVVVAKALRRKDVLVFFAALGPCLVGMEACGSAHHWGRELMALGHDVKLIPPAYVKPFGITVEAVWNYGDRCDIPVIDISSSI